MSTSSQAHTNGFLNSERDLSEHVALRDVANAPAANKFKKPEAMAVSHHFMENEGDNISSDSMKENRQSKNVSQKSNNSLVKSNSQKNKTRHVDELQSKISRNASHISKNHSDHHSDNHSDVHSDSFTQENLPSTSSEQTDSSSYFSNEKMPNDENIESSDKANKSNHDENCDKSNKQGGSAAKQSTSSSFSLRQASNNDENTANLKTPERNVT